MPDNLLLFCAIYQQIVEAHPSIGRVRMYHFLQAYEADDSPSAFYMGGLHGIKKLLYGLSMANADLLRNQ